MLKLTKGQAQRIRKMAADGDPDAARVVEHVKIALQFAPGSATRRRHMRSANRAVRRALGMKVLA
jgi:hypothetical protein